MPDNDFTFAHRDEGFDNHIDKSIRGYQDMLKAVSYTHLRAHET